MFITPNAKCMKCIVKKEAVRMPYIHMAIFSSAGATELFTLAGEYHYDNHACLYLEYIHILATMTNLAGEHKSQ